MTIITFININNLFSSATGSVWCYFSEVWYHQFWVSPSANPALLCRVVKNSFCNWHQNSSAICWILLQHWQLYKSGFLKSPWGGKTTLDYMVTRLIGLRGALLPGSVKVCTVKVLRFIIDSTFVWLVICHSNLYCVALVMLIVSHMLILSDFIFTNSSRVASWRRIVFLCFSVPVSSTIL